MSRFSRRGAIAASRAGHGTTFTPSFSQTAIAKIQSGAIPITHSQLAHARLRKTLTKTQAATANISTGLDFFSQTNWARPAFTTLRYVPFTTKAGFQAALTNMKPGDYIQYTGVGKLVISSTTTNAFTFSGYNPTGPVVIDLGVSKSSWNPSLQTPNYVQFSCETGTLEVNPVWFKQCSNLHIYGGDMTTNNRSSGIGAGILVYGGTVDCIWYDWYIHDVPGGGCSMLPSAGPITGNRFRGELGTWCQSPIHDPHADKGTGTHGMIMENSGSTTQNPLDNNIVAIYSHDSLAPGATGYDGNVWPEGAGGAGGQSIGNSAGTNPSASINNNTLYHLGVNNLMWPGNGVNPGSTGVQQDGGVGINFWGSTPLNGTMVGWVECVNCNGNNIHVLSGSWKNAVPPIKVLHGRHNANLKHVFTPNNANYPAGFNITYQDCI